MSTTKAFTARTGHYCNDCQWNVPEGTTAAIAPGHRYLRQVAFPGEPGHEEGTRPAALNQCIACACETEETAWIEAGACGTFCCALTPCALPFEKGSPGHDHSCRQCVREVAAA